MSKFSIPFFLARRLLFSKSYAYPIRIVTLICFSTITIGSLSLCLIFAIMQGFQTSTETKLQSIHPQVIMQAAPGTELNIPKITQHLQKHFPQVVAWAPNCTKYAVIQNPQLERELDLTNLVQIKGINPQREAQVSQIEQKLLPPIQHLTVALQNHQVAIGSKCAKLHNLKIGEAISLFVPTEIDPQKVSFEKIQTQVGAIFQTGIAEFDQELIIASLEFMQAHFENCEISELGLKLAPHIPEAQLITELAQAFHVPVFSWREPYSTIVSALKLEKYAGVLIAGLICLIASMTLVALLFMLITQHLSTITILSTLGCTKFQLRCTFTWISLIINGTATLIGLSLAWILGLLLQHYWTIELPDVYYVTTLPIQLNPVIWISIAVITQLITLIIAQIPISLINQLNLNQIIKTNY